MPLMGYRDSGGHFAVRYVPAFGGWRGKPGRIGRVGRTGRRGGGYGRASSEQHASPQLHVSRARHDRGMREPTAGGDGTCGTDFSVKSRESPPQDLFVGYSYIDWYRNAL
jgi:hypothetical protein